MSSRRHTHSVRDLEVWSERAVPTPTRLVRATGRLSRRSMPETSGCAQTDVLPPVPTVAGARARALAIYSAQCRVWARRLHRARVAAMAVEVTPCAFYNERHCPTLRTNAHTLTRSHTVRSTWHAHVRPCPRPPSSPPPHFPHPQPAVDVDVDVAAVQLRLRIAHVVEEALHVQVGLVLDVLVRRPWRALQPCCP